MMMRGGTSKGAFFLADDLPADPTERDDLILRIVGSPDPRQIDGIGGAHPLTTKVAVISPSERADTDVDYLFLQPSVEEPVVSDSQNCGNMLAGVGPFAVERGLVTADGSEATVRIRMVNTGSFATAVFPLRAGTPDYAGETAIWGVPGTAAQVRLDFEGISGGSCGAMLPTGNLIDSVSGVDCTLIDNGMPVVVMRADDLGVTGYEDCHTLEADTGLRSRIEEVRLVAGWLMNLGDVSGSTVPKLTLAAPPQTDNGDLCTRTFIPHRCHEAIGVLGAVSVATAALLPGTVANPLLRHRTSETGDEGGRTRIVTVEHPTGTFDTAIALTTGADGRPEVDGGFRTGTEQPIALTTGADGRPEVLRAGIVRTARKLADGVAFPRPG